MEQEKKSLYEKFDDGVMYMANDLVRSWNWVTGKTKNSLASTLNTSGTLLQVGADFKAGQISYAAIDLIPYIYVRDFQKRIEWEDNLAEKRNCLANPTSNFRRAAKYFGVCLGSVGAIWGVRAYMAEKTGDKYKYFCWSVGTMLQALSLYVARTDNLPPRKNVLSRAKDKLVEMLNETQQVPQPAMVPANYGGK